MQMWVDEYAGDSLLTRYRLAGSSDEQKRLVKNCLVKHFQHNWSVFALVLTFHTLLFFVFLYISSNRRAANRESWF